MKVQQIDAIQARSDLLNDQLKRMVNGQRRERASLEEVQENRQQAEMQTRQARFNKGLKGLMDFVTGKRGKIKQCNEQEMIAAQRCDEHEKDTLIFMHLEQRRSLERRSERLKDYQRDSGKRLEHDLTQYYEINQGKRDVFERAQSNGKNREHDPSRVR